MASIKYDAATKNAAIQFYDSERRRRGIRLSDVSKSFAERFHGIIERLSDAQRTGGGINLHDANYVKELGDIFYEKLVGVGLVEPREPQPDDAEVVADEPQGLTLGEFLGDYLARRTDLKGTSLSVYEHVHRYLVKHFGADKLLSAITPGDAIDFGRFLHSQKLARTTIDRRISLATTTFNDAVRHEYLVKNPFSDWRKPLKNLTSRTNKARQRFITRDDFAKLIEHAPDAEWRLILALARFGGLRTPSEPLSIKWGHIDWELGRITVTSPKTEHHEGRESRVIPMFPELRPYLEACWEAAEEGAEYIIAKHRPKSVRNGDGWKNANLRTMLAKVFKRAGLELPPKPWNNLRASRATELAEQYPGHVAAAWLGHTEEIANAHYRQVLPAHFEKALKTEIVMPQMMLSEAVSGSIEPQAQKSHLTQVVTVQEKTATCDSMQPFRLEAGGIEPPSCCSLVKASTCVER